MWWWSGPPRLGVSGGNPSGVQKSQEFTPGSEVYDVVYAVERERILQACFVQPCIINTHLPFAILFLYENRIGYPV
jgi:hypothetical protein